MMSKTLSTDDKDRTSLGLPKQGFNALQLSRIFSDFLALTSDGVVVFDGRGQILLANEEAVRLLSASGKEIVATDIRALFPPAAGCTPKTAFNVRALPFTTDGSAAHLIHAGSDGKSYKLTLRCTLADSKAELFCLLVCASSDSTDMREHDRLVEELSRANHRLSGTLKIVLDTIDSEDVATLLDRVLAALSETLDATGALLYVLETDGLYLRGATKELDRACLTRFISRKSGFGKLISQAQHTLMLRLLEPSSEQLRQGALKYRTVIDEKTRLTYAIAPTALRPFTSVLLAPIWFGGHVISVIELGWDKARQLHTDDAQLLDAVGRYLSVQLAGAMATLRQQKNDSLSDANKHLKEELFKSEFVSGETDPQLQHSSLIDSICKNVTQTLSAQVVPVFQNPYQKETLVAEFASARQALPFERNALIGSADKKVETFLPESRPALTEWLTDQGENLPFAVVDLGDIYEQKPLLLILKKQNSAPFDDLEQRYLERVVEDVQSVIHGSALRRQDRHISQALQTGMKNDLQKVEGISAEGLYSSATRSAFVGGDFYDLIRLPNQRACVIMGDVSGKGVEAASVSAAVKTALAAYSWEGLQPAHMVHLLNEFLLGFSRLETFATLFVGIIDLRESTLTYCSAGHPPALLLKAASGDLISLDVQSGVVGAFLDMDYHNGSVHFCPHDLLLLYTDGTTEARAKDGAFFGEEGLRDAVMQEAPAGFSGLVKRLLARLDSFTARNLEDDVAMVCLRFDDRDL